MATKRSTKAPDNLDLPAMYLRWLKGESLRSIAPDYGVSHNTISAYLCNRYGRDATDPLAMSLQRSLLADYPGRKDIEAWVMANLDHRDNELKYRSQHNLQQLGDYQNARDPEMMATLARDIRDPYDYLEPEPAPLSLPWIIVWLTAVSGALGTCLANTVLDPA